VIEAVERAARRSETHISIGHVVSIGVGSETALGRDAKPLKSLLLGLAGATGDVLGGIANASDELLLLLHDGELGGHKSENGGLGGGKLREGLLCRKESVSSPLRR
jgi:hypothetical protein